MNILAILNYALGVYFSAVLGIAGLAKLADPTFFITSISRSLGIRATVAARLGRPIGLLECALGFLLVLNIAHLAMGLILIAVFSFFCMVQVYVLSRGRSLGCGCYGSALDKNVSMSSVTTSVGFIILAVLYLSTGVTASSLSWAWTAPVVIIWMILAVGIAFRTINRPPASSHILSWSTNASGLPTAEGTFHGGEARR